MNGSYLISARKDSTSIPYQRPYFLILILVSYMGINSLQRMVKHYDATDLFVRIYISRVPHPNKIPSS